MGNGVFVISNAPGRLTDFRFCISLKPTLGRVVIVFCGVADFCGCVSEFWCIMASVCIWLWVGGLFCSVAFLSVDVGVWFAVFCTAEAFVRSIGDLLLVEDV